MNLSLSTQACCCSVTKLYLTLCDPAERTAQAWDINNNVFPVSLFLSPELYPPVYIRPLAKIG